MKARFTAIIVVLTCATSSPAEDRERLWPYILASEKSGAAVDFVAPTVDALTAGGFTIAGSYSPYPGAEIVVVTNEELQRVAAKSEHGGYGAVQRVSLTEVGGKVQISFTNPNYMSHVYRLESDLSATRDGLKGALGYTSEFGSEDGMPISRLRKYRYTIMMPQFDDQDVLAEYTTHEQALSAVESGLAEHRRGASKVYRVDIPGKDETVFGVAITEGDGADKTCMNVIDFKGMKQTAHLPWELLVSGKTVYALRGRFRIAQSFPDLSMGTFMKIVGAPPDIEKVLRSVAGGDE